MAPPTGLVLLFAPDEDEATTLGKLLHQDGHSVHVADDPVEDAALVDLAPDLLVIRVVPGEEALGLIDQAHRLLPHAPCIALTERGATERLLESLRHGADQCLIDPVSPEAFRLVVLRGIERALSAAPAPSTSAAGGESDQVPLDRIVGSHPTMLRLFARLRQAAKSRATVLIQGETGTGKELIAAALHECSKRREGPLVRLNCASLAEGVLESELFGHERGSFTGASTRRTGRFERAHGGTLFLDEVSEIPLGLQVKLLRFLQEREIERVGGSEVIRLDVRVVAATNRDLKTLVEDGRFREDLYYRLKVVVLDVPPLRARPSDVPLLADHFLRKHADESEQEIHGFTRASTDALLSYPWPGNVRELEHAIEQAVVFCQGTLVDIDDLPLAPKEERVDPLQLMIPGVTLAEVERYVIQKTLEAVDGSPSRAAAILGISRRTVQYRLQEWGLGRRDDRGPSEAD